MTISQYIRMIIVLVLVSCPWSNLANDDSIHEVLHDGESDTSSLNTPELRAKKIAIEILSDVIAEIEITGDILGVCNKEKKEAIEIDKGDFLLYWKQAILNIDSGYIKSMILNNHYSVSETGKVGLELPRYLSRPHLYFRTNANLQSARESVDIFENKVNDEARIVSKKYLNDDMKKWRRQGRYVPQKELMHRIPEAPNLHALLILQELLSCGHCLCQPENPSVVRQPQTEDKPTQPEKSE